MSAWSDAGWPSGIFFSRPRLAVNLIIAAVNELRVAGKLAAIATISEFASPATLRNKMWSVDAALVDLISRDRSLLWDYNRWGTDRAEWYPSWLEAAVGDCPRPEDIDIPIRSSQLVLRWVISRYKILCNCNRFSDPGGYIEMHGVPTLYGWLNFSSEADRTAYISAELDRIFGGSFLVGAEFEAKDGYYKVRTAASSRLRVTAPSVFFRGPGRYICAGKIVDPGFAQFDAALAPGAVGDLWWSPLSPLVELDGATVDATIYDQYWTFPYSINPGTATVGRGFGISTKLAVDLSDRRYYDPPSVWQNINV